MKLIDYHRLIGVVSRSQLGEQVTITMHGDGVAQRANLQPQAQAN